MAEAQDPWVIRTDFSDNTRWQRICELISAPQSDSGDLSEQFYAHVDFISREACRDESPHEIVMQLPDDYPGYFCFIVDQACIQSEEFLVLVVGFGPPEEAIVADESILRRTPKDVPATDLRTFRTVPSCIQAIENNLSIANMDFEDFADALDSNGVHRGFTD